MNNKRRKLIATLISMLETNTKTKEINRSAAKASRYTRGRKPVNQDKYDFKKDLTDLRWSYLINFQKKVGIRRTELFKLKGNDLVLDESGYCCIQVRNGKGGKYQLQRIFQEDVEEIKIYFEELKPDEY